MTATDISAEALSLAAENAAALGLEARARRRRACSTGLPGPFELVVSNPPYVLADELPGLEPEVRDWEPRLALVGERQTEELAAAARALLAPGGAHRARDATRCAGRRAVAALPGRSATREVAVTRDLAGRERVVEARWRPTR